jgi:hypothetical protein
LEKVGLICFIVIIIIEVTSRIDWPWILRGWSDDILTPAFPFRLFLIRLLLKGSLTMLEVHGESAILLRCMGFLPELRQLCLAIVNRLPRCSWILFSARSGTARPNASTTDMMFDSFMDVFSHLLV